MAEPTDPRLQRAIDVIVRIQRLDRLPAGTIDAFMPHLVKDAGLLLDTIDGPEPDWADIREAARKAGWSGRGGVHWVMWGAWAGEDVNDEHGWVIYHRWMRTVKVTVVGPGTGPMTNRSYAELMNPTPAKVFEAARLVGIGGDRD